MGVKRHSNDREIFKASLAVLGFATVVLAAAIAVLLYWLVLSRAGGSIKSFRMGQQVVCIGWGFSAFMFPPRKTIIRRATARCYGHREAP